MKKLFNKRILFQRTENLKLIEVRDVRPFLMASLVSNLILFLFLFTDTSERIVRYKTIIKESVSGAVKMDADIPLTDSAITEELVKQGCVLPNVALAQFKIESSHFKSIICKENKNFAGIKTSRSNYVKGTRNNHCVYDTYRDCIKDYIRIQNKYLENIDGRYAESSGYVQLVKKM